MIRLIPSDIGTYFTHKCDSRFAYSCKTQNKDQRVQSPYAQMMLDEGNAYEDVILKLLDGQVLINHQSSKLIWSIQELKRLLESDLGRIENKYIYQAQLPIKTQEWKALGISSELSKYIKNTKSRPDLLHVRRVNEQIIIDVIDIKHSDSIKLSHRVQVYLYVLVLRILLEDIPNIKVNDSYGFIWLKDESTPTQIEFDGLDEAFEQLFATLVPNIIGGSILKRKLSERCSSCPYLSTCTNDIKENKELHILASVTDTLAEELFENQIVTVEDFTRYLDSPEAKSRYKNDILEYHKSTIDVYHTNQVTHRRKQYHPYLPRERDLVLYLYADNDYSLGKPTTLAYYLAGDTEDYRSFYEFLEEEGDVSTIKISHPSAIHHDLDSGVEYIEDFFSSLYKILNAVNLWNMNAPQKLSVQFAFFKQSERSSFLQALYDLFLRKPNSLRLRQLIREFQSDRLLDVEVYPANFQSNNLLSLDSIFKHFLIVPAQYSIGLGDIINYIKETDLKIQELFSDPNYQTVINMALGDTVSSAIDRQPLFKWLKDTSQKPYIDWYRYAIHVRLILMSRIDAFLHAHFKEYTKFTLKPFIFEQERSLPSVLLTDNKAIHFFTHREQFLSLREWYQAQFRLQFYNASDDSVVLTKCTEFIQSDPNPRSKKTSYIFKFEHSADKKIKASYFTSYVLVPRDDIDHDGGFSDYLDWVELHFRKRPWGKIKELKNYNGRKWRVINGDQITIDGPTHFSLTYDFKNTANVEQEYFFISLHTIDMRERDNKVADLNHLESETLTNILLHQPSYFSENRMHFSWRLQPQIESIFNVSGMTQSKLNAYELVKKHQAVAVWGPPGTGKTFFLSKLLSTMVCSAEVSGTVQEYRILVVAFTHAAIDNVLEAIMEEAEKATVRVACKKIVGDNASKDEKFPPKLVKISNEFYETTNNKGKVLELKPKAFFNENPYCISGMTYFQARKESNGQPKFGYFDFIVIDEASQLPISGFVAATRFLKPGGKVLLTGDHFQLGPIVKGLYPQQENKFFPERSIFEHLMTTVDDEDKVLNAGIPTVQLYENFRMNECLTQLTAKLIYGAQYRPGDSNTSTKKLMIDDINKMEAFRDILDPEYPFVLIAPKSTGQPTDFWEAQVIAQLMVVVKETCYPATPLDEFFKKRLFVVSPHHKQINLIKQEVAALQPDWKPFVDTVDKMQGQEADVVLISYGLYTFSDAMKEAEFIYSLNRMNVSITRAKRKCILLLSQALFEIPATFRFDAKLGRHYQYFIELREILKAQAQTQTIELNMHTTETYRLSTVDI